MKKIMNLLIIIFIISAFMSEIGLARTKTGVTRYFCCIGDDGKCFTTDGTIWHTGLYHPCGTEPCTDQECSKKKVIDSDNVIELNVFFVIDQLTLNGIGYKSIDLYYDSEVKSGDVDLYDDTQEFTVFSTWLQAIQNY